MNMTEKNGQPSMEEILASIRRIIAEEPIHQHNGELGGTPILLKGDGVLDDAGDFDLPAIFRSSPPQTDRPSPLLGRLTDAIRSATAAQPEEPRAMNGHGDVHGDPAHDPHAALSTLTLRATEITRTDETGHVNGYHMNGHHVNGQMNGASPYEAPQAALVAPGASQPSVVQAAAPDEPKRVMAAFKDTHFMRLASSSPAPQPQPVAPVMPVAAMPAPAPVEVAPPEAVIAPAPVLEMPPPVIAQPAVTIPPPPLPATVLPIAPAAPVATGEQSPAIEDATADLLRPMLRQWLAENMPRMVEKALHIEIAESVKPTKKL